MDGTIDVPIPLDPEAAGGCLSGLLADGGARFTAIAALGGSHRAIKANGITDEFVDEELAIWRAERSANLSA
jgi:hypothetical protein